MPDITSIIATIGGAIAIPATISTVFSGLYQRRQTQLMEAQVDRQIEVTITRDLDAPEGAIDGKLRAFLNRRLSDIRTQMRQEFGQRLDDITRILEDSHVMERKDIAANALTLYTDQRDAVAKFEESNNRMGALEQQVQALQRAVEDIRNGVGNQAMVRAQIHGIAEQLLRMTGQEYGV